MSQVLYRAQVRGVGVDRWWVDGGLFANRKDAERDAERLADYFDAETQVVAEVRR